MGFFDSSSSESTTNVTNVKNSNVGADGGAIAASEGSTVNVLDSGVVNNSLKYADANSSKVFDFATENISQSFDFSKASAADFSKASAAALDSAFKFAKESLGLVETTVGQTQKSTDMALSAALSQTSSALASKDEAQSGGAQRLLYLAAAALVVLAFIAYKGH